MYEYINNNEPKKIVAEILVRFYEKTFTVYSYNNGMATFYIYKIKLYKSTFSDIFFTYLIQLTALMPPSV